MKRATKRATIIGAFLSMVPMAVWGQEKFDLPVERAGTLRHQRGTLHIDAQEIAFRPDDAQNGITIAIDDLREANVANPRALRFQVYDVAKWQPVRRREYTFRAASDAPVEQLARFLAAHIARPIVGNYTQSEALFKVPAYHRRAFAGSKGTLEIGSEAIRFIGSQPGASRTWLYRDIQTIGMPDEFRFRVTTVTETYVLELENKLPRAAYDLAWGKIYDNADGAGKR